MDLYSGLPYWLIKNSLYNYFNPLKEDYNDDIVIIGSGITGALVANELCDAGFKCTMIDKRSISTGSSVASTALLQYEIDTPLSELAEKMGEEKAVKSYECCLKSISDIKNRFEEIGFDPDFKEVPSVYYASNRSGYKLIKKEYEIRKRNNLPVTFLSKDELYDKYKIKSPGALENNVSAQMDAYAGATHLISHRLDKKQLKVFSHTEITEYKKKGEIVELTTKDGYKITCKHLIIAAGFEAGTFLPKPVMKLTSTYAIISEPIEEELLWQNRSLIWETKDPYLYIRTTNNNRIMVGGEDEDFKNPEKRDSLLRKKVNILEKKMKKLLPDVPFKTEMAWCGTFSSTEDGLPFIGTIKDNDNILYALGYGGNGITFSMIAAQIITNKISGKYDEREDIFGFQRIGF